MASQRRSRKSKGAGFATKRERFIALVAAGSTQREAAEEVGVHQSTASRWLATDEAREALAKVRAEIQGDARTILKEGAAKAARTLVTLAEVDRQAAIAVLDRVGIGPSSKVEVEGDYARMTDAELARKARELAEQLEGEGDA